MCDLWASDRDYRRLRIGGKTSENPHRKLYEQPQEAAALAPSSCHVLFSVSKDSECVRWWGTVWELGREWVTWDQKLPFFLPWHLSLPLHIGRSSQGHTFPVSFLSLRWAVSFSLFCLLFCSPSHYLSYFTLYSHFIHPWYPFLFLFIHVRERVLPNH